jgi:hypothetical protein
MIIIKNNKINDQIIKKSIASTIKIGIGMEYLG